MFIGMMLLVGCAPSVTVIPAGQAQQYEVTVHSNELTLEDTEGLILTWHQKARETCGSQYGVISRDVIEHGESSNDIVITGIIECQ
jgi:hypothetical protein